MGERCRPGINVDIIYIGCYLYYIFYMNQFVIIHAIPSSNTLCRIVLKKKHLLFTNFFEVQNTRDTLVSNSS